jgi:dehydrogenase/reductase SDR family member 12
MDLRTLADDLLELVVVPSFSRIGPVVRSRLYGWTAPPEGALVGMTALVTGATGGLGGATARALSRLGARVILVGRDGPRLASLRDELVGEGRTHAPGPRLAPEGRFPIVVADLSSLAQVRSAVEEILAVAPRLDVVVDNAGAIYAERTTGPDGGEASLALMAVGPFALIAGLMPSLGRSADPRVISVTSGGMYAQALDLDDLDGDRISYSGPRFYARAKRAQVALVREWARRSPGRHVTFVSMHPGWAATPGLAASLPGFTRLLGPLLRSPDEGIETITWLATVRRDAIEPGRMYLDRRPRPFDRVPWTRLDPADRRRLWQLVAERAGVGDPSVA